MSERLGGWGAEGDGGVRGRRGSGDGGLRGRSGSGDSEEEQNGRRWGWG